MVYTNGINVIPGSVLCKHNSQKLTLARCTLYSDEGCGVNCGASNTQDAEKRCNGFCNE